MQYVKERLEFAKTVSERSDNVAHTRKYIPRREGFRGPFYPTVTKVVSGLLSCVKYQGIRSAYKSGIILATCSSMAEGSEQFSFYCSDGPVEIRDEFSLGMENVHIKVIEWDMMDKFKFYPLSMLSSFTIRTLLYPFTLIKTKMQIQTQNSIYKNMRDCLSQTVKDEGMRGLYRGFWVSAFQIISGVFYVSTYEGVRHELHENGIKNSYLRALIAGGCASVVGQTCIVPFDVISQHMMIVGMNKRENGVKTVYNPLGIIYEGQSRYQIAKSITSEIYRRDGFRGFYRGYLASLGTYVPNSALWWGFYHAYQTELEKILPSGTPHLMVQCISAMLGGFTTTVITNPLDVCRARLQVQRLSSFRETFTLLWTEDGFRMFSKGLSARMLQSGMFSVSIILGYESIKRLSVREEYKHRVKW